MTSHPGTTRTRTTRPAPSPPSRSLLERQALHEQEQQRAQAGWGGPAGHDADRGAAPVVGQPAWGPPAYPYATEPPYGGWGPQPVQDHPRAILSLSSAWSRSAGA